MGIRIKKLITLHPRQVKDYYMSWNSPGLEQYIWNYLPPLLNAIGSSSSVIVVFLTLNRYAVGNALYTECQSLVHLGIVDVL